MSETWETATKDRLPPHSIEAEQAVIGCILLDNKTADECQAIVGTPEAFYDLRHRTIYIAIQGLITLGQPVDSITLRQWLKDDKKLDQVGGDLYIGELQDKVPTAHNYAHWCQIVAEKYVLRRIVTKATEIAAKAYEHNGKSDMLVAEFESQVMSLRGSMMPKEALDGDALGALMLDDAEQRFNLDGKLSGLDTGLHDLNRMIEGMQNGEQFVVGARPSMGKTAMACGMIHHVCFTLGIPAVFISLEMSAKAIMRRLAAIHTRIPARRLRSGRLEEQDFPKLTAFRVACKRAPLYIIDGTSGMTSAEISSHCRRLKLKHDIKFVVVDYLQKVKPDSRHEKRTYEVADVSGKLKAIAVELDIPVMTLAQINRENEKQKGRAPRPSDLADSGQIERDADVIGLLHNDEEDGRQLIIAKQRDGETGLIPLAFLDEIVKFENRGYSAD